MQLPTTSTAWEQISNGFQSRANFPNCIGAVDGKHIRVKKPSNSGSMYFNYKDYFSIILLAVVDSEYRFIYVSVGSYGKDCDSSIFKGTTFWKKLTENALHLPIPRPLNKVKRVFNYRLTRARRYVECAFGILSNKWRIFHRPLDVNVETAICVVKACTVLHNFVRQKDGFDFQSDQIEPEINCFPNILNAQSFRGGSSANSIRATFAEYFVSKVGSVPWQDEFIGF
ncbi:hypothetical protein QTP88_001546 [Uroleucon formosanum]